MVFMRDPVWVESYRRVQRNGKIKKIRPHWNPRRPHPRL
jgi:hypothetical protein